MTKEMFSLMQMLVLPDFKKLQKKDGWVIGIMELDFIMHGLHQSIGFGDGGHGGAEDGVILPIML
jgi:hypothetical protein